MSTFRGVMQEFPDVRVDFFRQQNGLRPPLACFLSHVHSDHLAGLESLKSPFVYCSAATKEMLLKLERYPHQLNFELGILESRKQHYKHLQNLLKPIPLETPTLIELSPGNELQVTLFDANHCTGAVMFLFEGQNKAVLYTGDIRSEPWFVNNLSRNPFLVEYTTQMKTLDCIYLDTSNLNPFKFPTKAEGLKELLGKVVKYPADTIFHFSAWTFGYEEVWITLSRFLKSPIHVDKYKMRLYNALRASDGSALAPEAPALAGFTCGNTPQPGCLTSDNTVRIHSCGKGMNCPAINDDIVWIQPIVTRTTSGVEIEEVGVGGGGGDLSPRPELDLTNPAIFQQLLQLIANDEGVSDIKAMLVTAIRSSTKVLSLDDMGFDKEEDEMSLADLIKTISKSISDKRKDCPTAQPDSTKHGLPKRITFPYSRHSSMYELRDLVDIFRPKDVYPCTVDEENWEEVYSMEYLFGPYCSDKTFRHDKEMREIQAKMLPQSTTQQTQTTDNSDPSQELGPSSVTQLKSTTNWPINRRSASEPKLIPLHGNPPPNAFAAALSVTPSPRNPPGPSVSSPLRRKAVEEQLGEDRTKRPRLDIPASNLPTRAVHENSNSSLTLSDRMNHSRPVAQETSNSTVELVESMKSTEVASRSTELTGFSKFQPVIHNSSYQPGQQRQENRPDRAQPSCDIRMNGIANEEIRANINRIQMLLPDVSIYAAREALLKCRGDLDEAMNLLPGMDKDVQVISDDELSTPATKQEPQPVAADNQSPFEQKVEEGESEEGEDPSGSQGSPSVPSSGESNASSDSHCTDTPDTYQSGSLFLGLEVEDYGTFNDKVDRVVRCKSCTHEFWGKYPDCCTNCNPPTDSEELTDGDVEDLAFHEVQESYTELDEEGLRPRMSYEINPNIRDVYDEETLISLADICKPYLDCGSSAYDSQDDDPKFAEEYETNSFIDDEEPEEDSEEENASSDDEVDYKDKFKKLQESHRVLQHNHAVTENRHLALKVDFQEFRRDIMGSDYDSEGMNDSEEMEEEGIILVDVTPPDPVVAEVVLSESDEGASDSLMGELRKKSIKQEMSTANGESDEEGYTMVTPYNNHTTRELEL